MLRLWLLYGTLAYHTNVRSPLVKRRKTIAFELDSHEVFIPFDMDLKKKGDYCMYDSVSVFPHKILLPMEKQIQLKLGMKAISFSLSYTDPEDSRIYQRPKRLLIILKDLSLLEETLFVIQEEK